MTHYTPSMIAIPTAYKGVQFRSRLEARWAVFFDALRITWEYEPKQLSLANGIGYTPDFFLPAFYQTPCEFHSRPNRATGVWIEVKPALDYNEVGVTKGMVMTLRQTPEKERPGYFIGDAQFKLFQPRYLARPDELAFKEQFIMQTKTGIRSVNNDATMYGKRLNIALAIDIAKTAAF